MEETEERTKDCRVNYPKGHQFYVETKKGTQIMISFEAKRNEIAAATAVD